MHCDHIRDLNLAEEAEDRFLAALESSESFEPEAILARLRDIAGLNALSATLAALAIGTAVFRRRKLGGPINVRGLIEQFDEAILCRPCLASWYREEFEWRTERQQCASVKDFILQFVPPGHADLVRRELAFDAVYRIEDSIGHGAFGRTMLATQLSTGQKVALKFPHQGLSDRERQRLIEEARYLGRLRHPPHVVRVHDAGFRDAEQREPFLCLEYFAGGHLETGRFSDNPAEGAHVVEQVARGVAYVHAHGMLHRDIKPRNILINEHGEPAIGDFGFATALERESVVQESQTRYFTKGFSSPEQVRGESATVRSDVYSLGATLYSLIEGMAPVREHDGGLTFKRIQDVSLKAVCQKALATEQGHRYESASQFADDLRRIRERRPTDAERAPWTRHVRMFAYRHPFISLLLATAVLLLASAAFSGLWAAEQSRQQIEMRKIQAVRLADQGIGLCEQDDLAAGLLTMSRALSEFVPDQATYATSVRRAIAAELSHVHTLEMVIGDMRGMVMAAAFSPDGSMLALGDDKGEVRILRSDDLQTVYSGGMGAAFADRTINVLAWQGGKKHLLLVGTGTKLTLLDVRSATIVTSWEHGAHIRSAEFIGPEGNEVLVAGYAQGRDSACAIYTLQGDVIDRPRVDFGHARVVAASSDGGWVATGGGDRQVRLFRTDTGEAVINEALMHPAPIFALDFRPDGEMLATGCLDGKIRLFAVPSGRLVGDLPSHTGPVRSLDFGDAGHMLLSGSEDGTARLWDVSEPLRFRALGQRLYHLADVRCVTIDQSGRRFVTAGMDGSVRLWRRATPREIVELRHPAALSAATFSPDQRRVLSASLDHLNAPGEARVWSRQGDLLHRLPHGGEVLAAMFRPRNPSHVATIGAGGVKLWRCKDGDEAGELIRKWEMPGLMVAGGFSPDGKKLAFAGRTQTIFVSDLSQEQLRERSFMAGGWISSVQFSPTGKLLLTDGAYVQTPSGGNGPLNKVATALLWDVQRLAPVGEPMTHQLEVRGATFSHDGERILTLSFDGEASLWSAPTGRALWRLPGDAGRVSAGAFSPDDRMIAAGGAGRTVRLWRSRDGRLLHTLPQDSWVRAISFHPTGVFLAVGGDDGIVKLWDVQSGAPLGAVLRHDGRITSLEFSLDGTTLLSAGEDGVAKLWRLPKPIAGSPAAVTQLLVRRLGLELAEDFSLRVLDANRWAALAN